MNYLTHEGRHFQIGDTAADLALFATRAVRGEGTMHLVVYHCDAVVEVRRWDSGFPVAGVDCCQCERRIKFEDLLYDSAFEWSQQ